MASLGKSKQLLSQFDGPVTFTGDVRFNQTLKLTNVKSIRTNGTVDIGSEADAGDCSDPNAALRVKGGVSIESTQDRHHIPTKEGRITDVQVRGGLIARQCCATINTWRAGLNRII